MFRAAVTACAILIALATSAAASDGPGVTSAEIKVGGIFPFSGPAASIGLVSRGVLAYVQSINDRGGINGRNINDIAYDDAYSPPKSVEHARRLVEPDAFMFSQLGTPGNTATAKCLKSPGVRSGFNVYPAEIEAVLNSHTDVVQSAVVGRKVEGNEEVIAFAQLIAGSPIGAGDLAAYIAPQLTTYKRPSEIILLSALPATSTGKISKYKLAESLRTPANASEPQARHAATRRGT